VTARSPAGPADAARYLTNDAPLLVRTLGVVRGTAVVGCCPDGGPSQVLSSRPSFDARASAATFAFAARINAETDSIKSGTRYLPCDD
jgi:hypothetical protein